MLAGIPAGHHAIDAQRAVRPSMRGTFADCPGINAGAVVGISMRQDDRKLGRRTIIELLWEPERQLLAVGETGRWLLAVLDQLLDLFSDSWRAEYPEAELKAAPSMPCVGRCAQ